MKCKHHRSVLKKVKLGTVSCLYWFPGNLVVMTKLQECLRTVPRNCPGRNPFRFLCRLNDQDIIRDRAI